MKYFKKLVGDRIYLSPRSPEDFEKYTEWFNNFNITDYLGRSGNIFTLEQEKEFLKTEIDNGVVFSIVTLKEDKIIGNISLERINNIHRCAMLGIFIGNEEYHSKGYGAEAINLILEYGFNYLNLHNISLDVLDFNERAKKCYSKCGFKETGRRRESNFTNGKYYDKIQMDILEKEFEGDYIRNKNI